MSEILFLFGKAIKQLRIDKGLSQEILAEKAGIHRTYQSEVERGLRNISLVNIAKLAVALEVSLQTIFTEMERLSNESK
nr:helix-turn-helix transcriptional regulator [uncultured Sphaerochaeta sp.]